MAEQHQTVLTILRRRDLEGRLKLSRSTIYDKINPVNTRGTLTPPLKPPSGLISL